MAAVEMAPTTPSVAGKSTESVSEDDMVLLKMGYKQELLRGFNALNSFSFCFTSGEREGGLRLRAAEMVQSRALACSRPHLHSLPTPSTHAVAVLSSLAIFWAPAVNTGGPSVLVWGWVICGFFTIVRDTATAAKGCAHVDSC